MKKNRDQVQIEIPPLFICQGNTPWKNSRPFTFAGVSKKGALLLEHGVTLQVVVNIRNQKGEFNHYAVIEKGEIIEGDLAHIVLPFKVGVPHHVVNHEKTHVRGFRERYVFFFLDENGKPAVKGIPTPCDDDVCEQNIRNMKKSTQSYVQTDNDGAILGLCIRPEHLDMFHKMF